MLVFVVMVLMVLLVFGGMWLVDKSVSSYGDEAVASNGQQSESPALSKSAEVSEHDALIEILKIQNEKLEALKFGGCLIQCALFGILCFLAWERFDKMRAAQAIRDALN